MIVNLTPKQGQLLGVILWRQHLEGGVHWLVLV